MYFKLLWKNVKEVAVYSTETMLREKTDGERVIIYKEILAPEGTVMHE